MLSSGGTIAIRKDGAGQDTEKDKIIEELTLKLA